MIKTAIIMLLLPIAVGCGGAPTQMQAQSEPYSIISERPEAASGDLVIEIKVTGQPTQSQVKSIAESLIASRKDKYRNIVVRSFTDSAAPNPAPFGLSRLENGTIMHQFNSQAETQKIPTH